MNFKNFNIISLLILVTLNLLKFSTPLQVGQSYNGFPVCGDRVPTTAKDCQKWYQNSGFFCCFVTISSSNENTCLLVSVDNKNAVVPPIYTGKDKFECGRSTFINISMIVSVISVLFLVL